ncbi:hypothetical protein Q8F55_001697 [Vanrija albida]|uniref:Carboxylesterase type B domain-containing protein n=1 Tax=Vanrija albida TaxID=181172 RepID=A0ABR3Q7N4_9TREE
MNLLPLALLLLTLAAAAPGTFERHKPPKHSTRLSANPTTVSSIAPTTSPSASATPSSASPTSPSATPTSASASPTATGPTEPVTCPLTWNGTPLAGAPDGSGVCRYTIRYGSAKRFLDSVPATEYGNTSALAPSCPQPEDTATSLPATSSEDCLYLTLYVPSGARALPVLAWLHGSTSAAYSSGSDSKPGLNGTALASSSNIVVAEIQYRIGTLGFLAPKVTPFKDDPNFALRDIVLALKTLKSRAGHYGGDGAKITLGGQGTGASLVRDWPLPPSTTEAWLTADLWRIMREQADQLAHPWRTRYLVPYFYPYRPTYGTATLPSDPTKALFNNPSSLAISPASTPLLITYTADEGNTLIGRALPDPVPLNASSYNASLGVVLDPTRAGKVMAPGSPYELPATDSGDTLRHSVSRVVTDAYFRCPARSLAAGYAAAGGKVYVAEWTQGLPYPTNSNALCTGKVCHGDDIYPTFGTSPSPGPLEAEVQAAWASFITTGAISWTQFPAGGSVDGTNVKALGGGAVGACPANYWGSTVKHDWQMAV